ncbi:C39 family peptidase [Candidatus Woesearchaeota archaeon]|nr:C39 family peptidase [Candidatus Woesearchaeota archaeon]
MKKLPAKFIVSRAPKEYLKQGLRYCGGYTVKAILSAYSMDGGGHPKKYLPIRFLGVTTPKLMQQILQSHGFGTTLKSAKTLPDENKIQQIKKELNKNHPIILLIGNGYSPWGTYSKIRRNLFSHWISIWGYNDREKVFYVYDSCVPLKRHDKKIPIGNTKRKFEEVLRDWGGGFPWLGRYMYIPVVNNQS